MISHVCKHIVKQRYVELLYVNELGWTQKKNNNIIGDTWPTIRQKTLQSVLISFLSFVHQSLVNTLIFNFQGNPTND